MFCVPDSGGQRCCAVAQQILIGSNGDKQTTLVDIVAGERLIAGVLEEANGRSIEELAAQRDAGLLAVLRCPQREA